MTAQEILKIARDRRAAALASLKAREENLFLLAEYRMQSQRREKPTPVFTSSRATRTEVSLEKRKSRLAA